MIRVGAIDFLNAAPLCLHLPRDHEDWHVTDAMPSQLAASLRRGDLDVGLVPQVEACFNPEYTINDRHCIACDGEVASILLFHDLPWDQLKVVAVDHASNSSVALLQVLRHLDNLEPLELVVSTSDLHLLGQQSAVDGVLLIGDAALQQRASPGHQVTDLGLAWKTRTDLPFVFAVWLARSHSPDWVVEGLTNAALQGLAQRPEIARRFVEEHPSLMDVATATDYLQHNIRYQLGEAEKRSIEVFHRLRCELDQDLPTRWKPRYLGEER